ncbi:MAG: DUF5687 family protein [Cyclobacteriaceae bacterium]
MYELFIHQWKEKVRSSFWQKNIFLNILLGILGLYFVANIVVVSLFADKILLKIYTDRNVVEAFTGLLFYYFSFDLIVRFLFQQLPTISIQPYLTLPIKKSLLLHYPLLRSITSFFNVFAVLLFLPFFIKNIWFTQSFQFSFTWIIIALSLVGTNNFLNFSLKKYFSKIPLLILTFLGALALIIYLDITNVYSFSDYFAEVVYYLSANSLFVILPVSILALSYYSAYSFLRNHAYIEDPHSKAAAKSAGLTIFDQFGEIGQLIGLEVKMVLRNKRPKSLLYIGGFFVLYGFMFYRKENLEDYFIMSFMGLLLTSWFSINYGQYLFSWESAYFDAILANKIGSFNYIKSKHLFFSLTSILGYLTILPYAFISYKIALINAAFLVFNIGITSVIILFFCLFNKSYIDLGKSQMMNFQGTGVVQYLLLIPIAGLPFLIAFLCNALGGLQYYYYAIAAVGFLGIVFNKNIIQSIANKFERRKYKMAAGFREK